MNTSGNDRVKAIREAVSMIARAQDPIMRDELLRQLAECSGTREQTLREELLRLGRISSARQASSLSQKAKTVVYDAEVLLLSTAVHNPLK
ncbi:MAG: hypothetical protein GWN86_23705, partial [Desulfobacterales bacterium]|nr:hypothetical protein [Desulfobacterales bacterium]